MRNDRVWISIAAIALSGAFLSCASDKNESSREEAAKRGYDIALNTAAGCPNIAEFYGRLNGLEDSGWIRRHTVSMRTADKNSEGPASPRANHLSVLAFSNFEFTELPISEYRTEAPEVTQEGCSLVHFGAMTYEIKEASTNQIRIAQMIADPKDKEPDPAKKAKVEKTWLTYTLTSARSVDIASHHQAIDPCYGDRMIDVEKTTRLRWGPSGDPAIDEPQEVDLNYIARATRALSSVPEGIRALNTEMGSSTLVSVTDLRELKASEVRTDLKVCPYRPGPPDVDDPEMPSSETTVPEPTPAAPIPPVI